MFSEASRFAGYVEGARNAGNIARSGDAVRQAVKWDTDTVEGSRLAREDLLGSLLQSLEVLEDRTGRLDEIAEVTADLRRRTDHSTGFTSSGHADDWASYVIPNNLQASGSRLVRLLEALIAEAMEGERS